MAKLRLWFVYIKKYLYAHNWTLQFFLEAGTKYSRNQSNDKFNFSDHYLVKFQIQRLFLSCSQGLLIICNKTLNKTFLTEDQQIF